MSEIRKRMIAEVERNDLAPVTVEAGARLAIGAVAPELERLEVMVKALDVKLLVVSEAHGDALKVLDKRIAALEARLQHDF